MIGRVFRVAKAVLPAETGEKDLFPGWSSGIIFVDYELRNLFAPFERIREREREKEKENVESSRME